MDIKFLQNEHYNYKNQLKSMVDLSDKNEVINLIARNNNPYNLQPTSMMYPLRSQGIKKKKNWSSKCLVTNTKGTKESHNLSLIGYII